MTVALSDLFLDLRTRASCDDDDDERWLEDWYVDIRLAGEDDGEPDERLPIGRVSFFILDALQAHGSDVIDVLESWSMDLGEIARALFDPVSGAGTDKADDYFGVGLQSGLIIHEMELDREYRGQGLGPILLGHVIQKMQRGCNFAALVPGSLEGQRDKQAQIRAKAAIARTWEKLGFEHFEGNVWVLDLTMATFENNLAALIEGRSASS